LDDKILKDNQKPGINLLVLGCK